MGFQFPLWHIITMAAILVVIIIFLLVLFIMKYEGSGSVDWRYWKQQFKLYLVIYTVFLVVTTAIVLSLGERWQQLQEQDYEKVTAISIYLGTFMIEFVILQLVLRNRSKSAQPLLQEQKKYVELVEEL